MTSPTYFTRTDRSRMWKDTIFPFASLHAMCCLFAIAAFLFLQVTASGQVIGKITDLTGSPLPYAAVYIEGTSQGTISNAEGMYLLEIQAPGKYAITFQYVGYKKISKVVDYVQATIVVDVELQPDELLLDELTITDKREDPAYDIMRKVIQKRTFYYNQSKNFQADLYVKGVVKLVNTPEEILGKKIGDLGGVLDSARQGIVYLSESKSDFYCLNPERTKEVMVSSIRSEGDDLFTANQFSWASFDLYKEFLSFSRSIVSPLADNAFSHYKFKLEGATVDQNGMMINKIKLIPRSVNAPLMEGYIYITEGLWNLYSTDVTLFGNALKNTFIDTIQIKQVYVPVKKPDYWRLFSQVFTFKAGLLSFQVEGNFSYIFSNYQLDKDVSSFFLNNETFKVEDTALNKDTSFWKQERPIPLTMEEEKDYIRKDSLQRIWNSATYRDSVDRENNKFGWLDFVNGYTWEKTSKRTRLSFPSPLSTLRFNALEGFKGSIEAQWQKSDSLLRKWNIKPRLEYGFSDKTWKPMVMAEYLYDNYNQGKITVSFGKHNSQFEPREPITERNNTWNSLWNKENIIRMYRHHYFWAGFEREVSNGFFITLRSGYSDRRPLDVTTQYSFRKKEEEYAANIPRADLDASFYAARRYWKNQVHLLLRPWQTYSSYPNVKVRNVSDWPDLKLEYEHGLPLDAQTSWFHKITARIRDEYVNLRLFGYFSYNVEAGTRLGGKIQHFGDFFHPMGNELLTPINPDLSSFNLLPYYEYSTDKYYTQVNIRHHFNGFLLDHVPLINKTSIKLVVGGSLLYIPSKRNYLETFIGIENIRVGPIQLLDIDYTWAFDTEGSRDSGFTLRLSQLFNN
jgi:hypothetical protein